MDLVLYIHGMGGSAAESEHYAPLFPDCEVVGLDYRTFTPWETGDEIRTAVEAFRRRYDSILLIANSIGAFFSMYAGIDTQIRKAYFISPIVDMEDLILGMMRRAGVTEDALREAGTIRIPSGEELSWQYLQYVRTHLLRWNAPTAILYGSRDDLTSCASITSFSEAHGAHLTVMDGGEHWFHTPEQMRFLDAWIVRGKPCFRQGSDV